MIKFLPFNTSLVELVAEMNKLEDIQSWKIIEDIDRRGKVYAAIVQTATHPCSGGCGKEIKSDKYCDFCDPEMLRDARQMREDVGL
jgi:hypothetical protein